MLRQAAVSILLLILVACTPSGAWPKSAGDTSCSEWTGQLTADQRAGLADAMLAGQWTRDGAGRMPSHALGVRFADAISGVCASDPTEKVSAVAATVYVLSTDLKPGN